MTDNLFKKADRLRHLAMLLAVLCGFATAHAQLYSDDISAAILVDGSVAINWTNDAENPWYIPEGESYIRTPEADDEMTTTLECTYSSSYPTEITLSWREYSNNGSFTIVVDGETKGQPKYSRSWYNSDAYMIPAGNHTVQFVYTSSRNDGDYWAGIRTLRIWECKELESGCIAAGSLPLKFENDPDNLWIAEDGYIRSTNTSSSTSVSTTFTVKDKPALLYYEYRNLRNYSSYSYIDVYVNGVWFSGSYSSNWSSNSLVLYPGEHTVVFANNIYNNSTSSDNVSEVRNVRLVQNWYDVTLNAPGELGNKLTQASQGKPLQDMELLKINGAMNSTDWEAVQLLTGIKAIDFTDTGITAIPENACKGLSKLSTVMLPETVKSIGDGAFYRTNFYQVSIPASVESIGSQAWYESNLIYIDFEENSKLSFIGDRAFYNTRIIEFDMPDSVESLGTYYSYGVYYSSIFENCKSLQRLHLSNGLQVLPGDMAYGCTTLSEVHIPDNATTIGNLAFYNTALKSINLPESLTTIGNSAFQSSSLESIIIPKNVSSLGSNIFSDNKNLKEVTLNSHCWDMYHTFSGCTALEKVILPCATPPTIYTSGSAQFDPFSGVNKSQVTLVVPDFAFDTYRANSYWYNFTNTVKGDEASINDYWALRGTLNLNSTLVMQGKPDVESMEGSVLTLDTNSAQTFGEYTYNTSFNTPAVVMSQSNSVTADRLISKFNVEQANTWYFFSPITDVNMSEVTYPSSDSWVIRYYDGARRASEDATSGNWVNVPADGTLKAGQGYIIQARAAGWLYLPAASAAENSKFFGANPVTFELADNACETEANAGWNFVANPYPTYYDIYYIDMQAPITVWTGSTYKAYSLNDGDRGDDTFVLRPMQPFFVQKSTADLSTGMPLVGRQVNTTIDRSRAPRPATVDENRHKLNLELFCDDNEEADDYTRVVINEQASLAYETVRDASKFMTMNADVAQLYTLGSEGHPMAINERPYEDGNVALGVLLPAADRTYRISARRADRKAWLYDAETGMEADLTEGDYIFTASKTGIDNKRFTIRFAPAVNSVEGVDATDTVKVIGGIGSISVSAPAGSAVTVFATDGSVITNTEAENGIVDVPVAGGVYVVKVNGESYKTIVK